MKKILGLIALFLSLSCATVMAQKSETKVKPKTTTGDKVHNVFHPRHKRHHGHKYKHKHKTLHGHKSKQKAITSKVIYLRQKEVNVVTA